MSTHIAHPAGPSTSTPSSTGTPVGLEVQGPVSANLVAGAATPAVITPDPGAVAAAKAFRQGLTALLVAFVQHLLTPPAGYTRRGKVSAQRTAVIPRLIELVRAFPSLAPCDPDALAASVAWADAVEMVVTDLQSLLVKAEDTVRLVRSSTWNQANAIYIAAEHQARTDPAMEARIAPVRNALARGKRIDTAAMTSASASHVATKAQTRAAAAQQRAEAASATHARTVQAHAARHPTSVPVPAPGVNPQGPAPVPAAILQGPAVNPQGPAPGR